MPVETTLAENDEGRAALKGNELRVDAKNEDAAAVRGGAGPRQRTVIFFGGDVVDGDKRDQVGQISFKQSETDNVVDGRLGGELYIGLRIPDMGSVDAAMQDLLRAYPKDTHPDYPQGAFVFEVPVIAPAFSGALTVEPSGHTDTMWAPDGLSFTQQQSDGNFVSYRTTVPFSKAGNHVKALWSAWTGRLE